MTVVELRPRGGGRGAQAQKRRSSMLAGLFVAGGVLLALQVVREGLAAALERDRPAEAVAVGGPRAASLARLAELRLRSRNFAAAEALARRALADAPLDVRALRVLGQSLIAQGRVQEGAGLMRFAGERSWRDSEVQAWLLEQALRQRDFRQAFRHVDALLRRVQQMQTPLYQLLTLSVADPGAADAIVEILAGRPRWREEFLRWLAREARDEEGVARVFRRLDRSAAPLNGVETQAYVTRLVGRRLFREAGIAAREIANWPPPGSLIVDGEFEGQEGLSPFVWSPVDSAGVRLEYAQAPDQAEGAALRTIYDGFSSREILRQMVLLEPGDYRLTINALAAAGEVRRLRWTVRCAGGGDHLATVEFGEATTSWSTFFVDFSVPADSCEAQWIGLEGETSERRTTITAWFDDLVLKRRESG